MLAFEEQSFPGGVAVAAGIHAFLHPVDAAPGQVPDPLAETGISSGHTGGAHRTLLCAHPPFQIDGNFGGTAGITEMLLQSWGGSVFLLPALPGAWPEGRVQGLRVRGAAGVDLEWADGQLRRARIASDRGGRYRIEYRGQAVDLELAPGQAAGLAWRGGRLQRA